MIVVNGWTIHAHPLVGPVDIFDESTFKAAVDEATGGSASIADAIANATARTITERMDEDRSVLSVSPPSWRRRSRSSGRAG